LDSDSLLALKYKSIAFTQRMRDLHLIHPSGTAQENKPQAIPPVSRQSIAGGEGELTNKVESAPAFGNQRLN
jgi:hypothetical protein